MSITDVRVQVPPRAPTKVAEKDATPETLLSPAAEAAGESFLKKLKIIVDIFPRFGL